MDVAMPAFRINGRSWDLTTPLTTLGVNTLQEWTIKRSGSHPFHFHVYHMQLVTPDGCGHHEEDEWYDVISVRFLMLDFGA
jgi:FtsP/CotA-like multicopper oxidase with cupredoxin domain